MPPPAVRLALLWHMHQPYYLDPDTGESVLPWVRLHALKDYWGMVALFDECPGMRATFNLVPSLIEQVEAYAAERTWDRMLVLGLRPAAALDRAEADWLVREGFHAHAPTMIEPYPRYADLWRRQASAQPFDVAALRDLQVWQKLAWVDPDVAAADARVGRLHAKGRDFDEDDKVSLRAVELDLLRRVVPAYRAAAERGQIELSCSPYYHPILPLLCDSAAHHDAHPGAPLPNPPFRFPQDADHQLARAIEAHIKWFGVPPRGVWPSEGSVSPATAAAVARAGLSWMASDEEVLRRSRGAAGLPTPDAYRFQTHEFASADGDVRLVFRDHGLSDAIGFAYQRWPAEAAAGDFLARVRAIGAQGAASGSLPPTVAVILDGENAWEHYPGGGRPFLRRLYRVISEAADIEAVTMGEATQGPAVPLPRLFSGSWIHGDFGIWIGHADDRRAWTQLVRARSEFERRRTTLAAPQTREAMDALLAAEGSDWFWWYGDDHSSAHDREFDALFRRHLRRAWAAMGLEPPEDLHRTNITTEVAGDDILRLGLTGDRLGRGYLQRIGLVALERPSGTMHRGARSQVRACDLGATVDALVAAVDVGPGLDALLEVQGTDTDPVSARAIQGTATVPWSRLRVAPGDILRARLLVRDADGRVVETVPADGLGRRLVVPATDGLGVWTA